jgi:hypothetical protein
MYFIWVKTCGNFTLDVSDTQYNKLFTVLFTLVGIGRAMRPFPARIRLFMFGATGRSAPSTPAPPSQQRCSFLHLTLCMFTKKRLD